MERTWTLPAAAALLALENVAVVGALLIAGSAPPLVPLFLMLKFPLCYALAQRRPIAFMVLTFWQAMTLVIALVNPALALLPRLGLIATATGSLVLLGLAIPTFPETRLPRRLSEGHGPAGNGRHTTGPE